MRRTEIKIHVDHKTEHVDVYGSWDNWGRGIPMTEVHGSVCRFTPRGTWHVTKRLPSGEYEFRAVTDRGWYTDSNKPYKLNGCGSTNNVLTVQ
jgi:hypothetical protein